MDDNGEVSEPGRQRLPPLGFLCVYCGYDLRGHAGDDRRCSECGERTTVDLLWKAWSMREGAIPATEHPIIPSLLFIPVMLVGPIVAGFWPSVWLIGTLAALLAVWFLGLGWFFRRYHRHHDRTRVLFVSHVVVVGVICGVFALPAGIMFLFFSLREGLLIAIGSLALLVSATKAYRDLQRRLPVYGFTIPVTPNPAQR